MKFMLMMNAPRGTGDWAVMNWQPDELKAHIKFMKQFHAVTQNEKLRQAIHEARNEIVALRAEIDKLCAPPSTYGVYLAANEDWRTLVPPNQWVFLAATFDYNKGTIALYKNGRPVPEATRLKLTEAQAERYLQALRQAAAAGPAQADLEVS